MNSTDWWRRHYAKDGTSGAGSRGELARYKADWLKNFVWDNEVRSIVELGCGDGYQVSLCGYEVPYVGYDPSADAVTRCAARKLVGHTFTTEVPTEPADLALSIDVVYHLVEDEVYDAHMADLFRLGERYVVIYSTIDDTRDMGGHMRHRDLPVATEIWHNPVDQGGCAFYVYEL